MLADTERARFGTEQGTEHLARLLRAHEQAGHDPYTVLRDGVTAGDFAQANALSQVVAARIDKRLPLDTPTTWTTPMTSGTPTAILAQEAEVVAQQATIHTETSYVEANHAQGSQLTAQPRRHRFRR